MPQNNGRLAEAVRARIQSKGWSQTTIAARGGPSTTSLTKITTGRGNLSPKMLAQIDAGMEWEPGRAAEILAGETEPVAVDLGSISNEALLREVGRRMKGATDVLADDTAQKIAQPPAHPDDDDDDLIPETEPAIDLLAEDDPPLSSADDRRSPRADRRQPPSQGSEAAVRRP